MANKLGVKKLVLDGDTLKVKLSIIGTDTEIDMAFSLEKADKLRHNADAFASVVARHAEYILGG
jgi:hypothetical protein